MSKHRRIGGDKQDGMIPESVQGTGFFTPMDIAPGEYEADQPEQTTDPLSACHSAPVKLVGGQGDFSDHEEGITMHYECSVCSQPANLAAPQQQPAGEGELEPILKRFYADKRNYKRKDHNAYSQAVQELEQLIASRLTALLDELEGEGPKNKYEVVQIRYKEEYYAKGFNDASMEWRALLARKKGEL